MAEHTPEIIIKNIKDHGIGLINGIRIATGLFHDKNEDEKLNQQFKNNSDTNYYYDTRGIKRSKNTNDVLHDAINPVNGHHITYVGDTGLFIDNDRPKIAELWETWKTDPKRSVYPLSTYEGRIKFEPGNQEGKPACGRRYVDKETNRILVVRDIPKIGMYYMDAESGELLRQTDGMYFIRYIYGHENEYGYVPQKSFEEWLVEQDNYINVQKAIKEMREKKVSYTDGINQYWTWDFYLNYCNCDNKIDRYNHYF